MLKCLETVRLHIACLNTVSTKMLEMGEMCGMF